MIVALIYQADFNNVLFMPPTLKKWGAYCFRLVRLFVRPSVQKKIKARVLKFHMLIPHQKIAYPFFFLYELPPLAKLCPFEGLKVQICNHDILKSITTRSFKLGQLIEADK